MGVGVGVGVSCVWGWVLRVCMLCGWLLGMNSRVTMLSVCGRVGMLWEVAWVVRGCISVCDGVQLLVGWVRVRCVHGTWGCDGGVRAVCDVCAVCPVRPANARHSR